MEMTTHNLIFHSRPRAEADWNCQRMRYYQYDLFDGIVKDNLTLNLFIGSCLHDALAAIATSYRDTGKVSIDSIAVTAGKLVKDVLTDYYGETPENSAESLLTLEQSTLVEALLRGFYRQTWPALIAQYPTVVSSEREVIFPHDETGKLNKKGPFVFMAKGDLVLLQGELGCVYVEFKSTSSKRQEWIDSWNKAIQVHATTKAIEFTMKQEVLGTIVQGLFKGTTSYGKYSSPLVYGYLSKGNPPFTKTLVSYEYKAGYKRTPVWEMQGGVKKWVEEFPLELLSEQFPQTPILFTDQELAETFFRQRAIRETDVMEAMVDIKALASEKAVQHRMDKYFPQSFTKCKSSFSSEFDCSYYRLCHGPIQVQEDPLGMGFIHKPRTHEEPYFELAKELLDA